METSLVAAQPMQLMTLTADNLKAHVQLIQKAIKAVMKEGVHYGKIPGTDKPTLYKAGSEVLLTMFRVAMEPEVIDLSTADEVRYRVRAVGRHQLSGVELGAGVGEASSNEEKYRWRNSVCDEEFDEAQEDRRRVKWQRKGGEVWQRKQVRTVPADVANTVLKMAKKRAQVDMTLTALAASDCFNQDLEDLSDDLREQGGDEPRQQQQKPATTAPRSTNGNTSGGGRATEKQVKLIFARMDAAGIPENELLARYQIQHLNEIPFAKVDDALAWIAQTNAA